MSVWILDDLNDVVDVREIKDNSVDPPETIRIEIRDHWTLMVRRKIHASSMGGSAIGDQKSSFSYNVGTVAKIKISAATTKYICVAHRFVPEQPGTPGAYVYESQTWELYSKWRNAPDGWKVGKEA